MLVCSYSHHHQVHGYLTVDHGQPYLFRTSWGRILIDCPAIVIITITSIKTNIESLLRCTRNMALSLKRTMAAKMRILSVVSLPSSSSFGSECELGALTLSGGCCRSCLSLGISGRKMAIKTDVAAQAKPIQIGIQTWYFINCAARRFPANRTSRVCAAK